MRSTLIACLVVLAAPTWACTVRLSNADLAGNPDPNRRGMISYRHGTEDAESNIDLSDCSVGDVSAVMSEVVNTRQILQAQTNPAVACAWAESTAHVLNSWTSPQSRPLQITSQTPIAEIIASTRFEAAQRQRNDAFTRAAETIIRGCAGASSDNP